MNNKYILSLLSLLIFSCNTYAAQIVYPKSNDVVINSGETFFIGNEKPDRELLINGEKVKIHPSGGFYHVVKLKDGENIFTIDNKTDENLIYKIKKPLPSAKQTAKSVYKEFTTSSIYITTGDNSPLRNAPDDNGKSRLQTLSKDIPLEVIGEYGKYYKIKLAKDDYAWIDKGNVKQNNSFDYSPAKVVTYTFEENNSKLKYNIKLDKKVPYIVSEKRIFDLINNKYNEKSDGLDITLYNVKGYAENKYELGIDLPNNLFGYKAYFTDGNEFVIEIKKFPEASEGRPLKGIKVTLDPGHGGSEYGAIGCLGDKEKDINLAIALKTKSLLEKAGAKVYLTRSDDKDLGLYDRVKISNSNDSDIFLSLHANALPDSLASTYRSGTSTYYFYSQSAPLARILLETMTKELGTSNDKVRQESFAVIRNTESPSVLIEVAYMINPDDNAKLVSPEFQNKAAKSIVHGLERYINELHEQQ